MTTIDILKDHLSVLEKEWEKYPATDCEEEAKRKKIKEKIENSICDLEHVNTLMDVIDRFQHHSTL